MSVSRERTQQRHSRQERTRLLPQLVVSSRASAMPPFASRPVKPSSLTLSLRRHPFTLFGLPFLSLVVLSSFALSGFTQTRYDYRDQKVTAVSKEDELGMRKDRRKIDVREEYWRMRSTGDIGESDEYENVRVARLPGQAEWGELPIAKKDD